MEVNGSNSQDDTTNVNGSNGNHSNISKVNGSNGNYNNAPEKCKKFPYAMETFDEATNERILEHFPGVLAAVYKVGPEKWILPSTWSECADKLYNFDAHSSDIWISTFPRSGTTWTQEMMWLLCNDLNYEAAKASSLNQRFPFFELDSIMTKKVVPEEMQHMLPHPALPILSEMKSPRLIKTHLPIKLMPHQALAKGCKIVYVARNPKDVLVSLFHFVRNPAFMYNGNFEQLAECFINDLILWGPFFEHIKDGWKRRNDSNILFLFYEDLVMDLENSLKKLAAFLGRPLNDNDLPDLMEHLNIKNFKENSSINVEKNGIVNFGSGKWSFIRRGQIGGNPEMSAEISEKIDAWMEEQLKGTDLKFPYQFRHKLELYKMRAAAEYKK